jgi:DNA modification methylase
MPPQDLSNFLDRVFLEDVLSMLRRLPDKSVDMVYGDPDYNVGVRYGENTYTVGFEEYIEWYIQLARESMRVLKDDGNLFFINYPKQNAYLRVRYLDAACYDVSDYSWIFNSNIGHSPKRFTTAHRSILHGRKTANNKFYKDNVAVPYQNPTDRRIRQNIANGSKGRMPYDWFYFDLVKNVSKQKTFHACQIPQELSEMLMKSCTMPGDIVLVLFAGSGSEVEVAKRIERRFISAEIDPKYHKMVTERLELGGIKDEYRLINGRAREKEEKPDSSQLKLLENRKQYVTKGSKRRQKNAR